MSTQFISPSAFRAPLLFNLAPLLAGAGADAFFEFCQLNPEYRMELSAAGELIVMPPAGGLTGARSAALTGQLAAWAERQGGGAAFGSSAGFLLPSGAVRSPSASWVEAGRWRGLTDAERERFPPLCPDFVAELCAPFEAGDTISGRKAEADARGEKVKEFISQGARLGWVLDPALKEVHVYRPGREPERLMGREEIYGGDVLAGFALDLRPLWRSF